MTHDPFLDLIPWEEADYTTLPDLDWTNCFHRDFPQDIRDMGYGDFADIIHALDKDGQPTTYYEIGGAYQNAGALFHPGHIPFEQAYDDIIKGIKLMNEVDGPID